ncbi:MAG TPA: alternative ribosome rescue aminoacyl-tRNA hydrolase ArfB [Ignavibacteria bacterium]|nr:alternative ribosome rescue aminoacyl-tRNA hydrolase ArfB [Ignavibacteria bacterium]HRJ99341.1 alternative ribosome rescue aminoacyl-tRNA hydrolase ArfB [Ignavibacteria bacterium]
MSISEDMRAEIEKELRFKTSRSGGKGGQNVNKVETKVELIFDITNSNAFTETEKSLLKSKLSNRITSDGIIKIISQSNRSQYLNKVDSSDKLFELIKIALKKVKKRKQIKLSQAEKEKRLQGKKKTAEKKSSRRFQIDKENY